MDKLPNKGLRILVQTALIVGIVIIYAYGLQVTKVDLEKPQETKRQEQLTNILRGLARPDLISYDIERLEVEAPLLTPCSAPAPEAPPAQSGQPSIILSDNCVDPGETITVTGQNFDSGDDVFLFFVPYTANKDDEVEVKLTQTVVEVEADGTFVREVKLQDSRTSERVQTIRAVVNHRVGAPRASVALMETRDKIIETVFLAFIATTLGVILGIPVSFLAARNLMFQVTSTLTRFMASLVAMPIGGYLGYLAFQYLTNLGKGFVGQGPPVAEEAWFWAVVPLIGLASVQAAGVGKGKNRWSGLQRTAIFVVSTAVIVIALGALGTLGRGAGLSMKASLGGLSFFGNFLLIFSDSILLGVAPLGALIGVGIFSSMVGRGSDAVTTRLPASVNKLMTIVFAAVAGAILFGLVTVVINWFYEMGDLSQVVILPGLVGAVIFAGIAGAMSPDFTIPTGMYVYYVVRTIMNIFRSIEPLVMVVAFAVWVGIGPFAGVMALGLHTIVALGKLYSEQVESIAAGPLEAITATGANRLQTIIYGVIPQIVPPYIAFTLYRWDINVRMSTIIGFGGGGGIGFLLSQNINLLKYRQASVNMIAIALVVASLDYISAKVREKIT